MTHTHADVADHADRRRLTAEDHIRQQITDTLREHERQIGTAIDAGMYRPVRRIVPTTSVPRGTVGLHVWELYCLLGIAAAAGVQIGARMVAMGWW